MTDCQIISPKSKTFLNLSASIAPAPYRYVFKKWKFLISCIFQIFRLPSSFKLRTWFQPISTEEFEENDRELLIDNIHVISWKPIFLRIFSFTIYISQSLLPWRGWYFIVTDCLFQMNTLFYPLQIWSWIDGWRNYCILFLKYK